MKKKLPLVLCASLLLGSLAAMTGCASDQKVTLLSPVGPDSGRVSGQKTPGYLIVYTETENPVNTGDLMYYAHTGYTVYDTHGAKVRYVRNHISTDDENPSRVSLPPGNYTVRAQSEMDGDVAVPVVIKGFRTTVVNLEKRSHDPQES
jgi:hypothetical protein